MRLLVLTQKVDINDDNLGFFHRWLEKFAEKFEKVIVVCLQKSEYHLPDNVRVLSLGKELCADQGLPKRKLAQIKYILNFYKYIWAERKNYDAVFVHMNPEYIVLGGLFWRLCAKKILLWYTHKSVNWKLKLAEKLVDKIYTASKESFRLASKKVEITGHGIDIAKFQISNYKFQTSTSATLSTSASATLSVKKRLRILTAGRIAASKNLDILIEAAEILKSKNLDFEILIAGSPVFEQDKSYLVELKSITGRNGLGKQIVFVGSIANKDMAGFYQKGDIFVNLSDTGSLDKAVLEAMAAGLLILTSNEAFKDILADRYFVDKNPQKVADRLVALSIASLDPFLRDYVVRNHNLDNLIEKITSGLTNGLVRS